MLTLKNRAIKAAAIAIAAAFAIVTAPDDGNTAEPDRLKISRQIFPEADKVTPLELQQNNSKFPQAFEIKGHAGIVGYYADHEVVTRSGPFMIRVWLGPQYHVKQAKVTSYAWQRGRKVRSSAFSKQFVGKGPDDPIKIDKDIDAMTSATISSKAMSKGVRGIIELIKLTKQQQNGGQTEEQKKENDQLKPQISEHKHTEISLGRSPQLKRKPKKEHDE